MGGEHRKLRIKPSNCPERKSSLEKCIVVEVTESPIPRPKNQKAYYSGKKKGYTIKTQVIINRQIEDIQQQGSVHDFKRYKDSIGEGFEESL
jgi:hypothetical protein